MHVREIKTEAKERFALNRYHAMLVYGVVYTLALNIAVLTTLLYIVNKWAVWYGVILIFLYLLMLAPFGFGMTAFYVKLYKFQKTDAFHIFDGFNKYNLERVIVLRLLKFALWLAFTLLLIVPGIVFAVRTSMANYLLRANPKLKPADALKASNRIMKTHCFKYFGLVISFAGWFLMGLLTCGLGFIWVLPYLNTAKTVFYKREIQGDKTVYRNPETGEFSKADENAAIGAEEEFKPEDIAYTAEYTEPFLPEISPEPYIEPQIEPPHAEVPAFEQAADGLKRMSTIPLPGGRVYLDSAGGRAVDRRRPPEPAQTEEEQVAVVEISEDGEGKAGESLRERISRERAERNAAARQSGGAIPRRRASDRRVTQEERNNIEIGERE